MCGSYEIQKPGKIAGGKIEIISMGIKKRQMKSTTKVPLV